MNRIIYAIDQFSKTIGHVFAWCIVILMLGTSWEVFVRYVLDDPTSWAFDFSYIMYGALFYMAGAYTLSRGGHVRADMFSRLLPLREICLPPLRRSSQPECSFSGLHGVNPS